ncbi:hypothetical protein DAI22_11g220400 [Oryza sativa Japonica Group]|nr:hypothetical protein DAI22_11g220400 [Oryza sativa Japonica Group]
MDECVIRPALVVTSSKHGMMTDPSMNSCLPCSRYPLIPATNRQGLCFVLSTGKQKHMLVLSVQLTCLCQQL